MGSEMCIRDSTFSLPTSDSSNCGWVPQALQFTVITCGEMYARTRPRQEQLGLGRSNHSTVNGPSKWVKLITSVLALCGPCRSPLGAWNSVPSV